VGNHLVAAGHIRCTRCPLVLGLRPATTAHASGRKLKTAVIGLSQLHKAVAGHVAVLAAVLRSCEGFLGSESASDKGR